MGSFSIWHWLIVLAIVALLFGGRGRIQGIMGDAAKGIRAFKQGLSDDDRADDEDEVVEAKPLPKTSARADATGRTTTTRKKTTARS